MVLNIGPFDPAQAPGQPLFFRDGGVKCRTTVPAGARPGQRFVVRRSDCKIGPKPGMPGRKPPLPPRPKSAPARRRGGARVAPTEEKVPRRPNDPYAHVDKKDPFRDPFLRDLPDVTAADRDLIKTYQARQKAGLCTDESYWKEQGFKAAGDPTKISEKKKKDYGFGAPKWSPRVPRRPEKDDRGAAAALGRSFGRRRDSWTIFWPPPNPTRRYYRHKLKNDAKAAQRSRSESVLGDQAWWEQSFRRADSSRTGRGDAAGATGI